MVTAKKLAGVLTIAGAVGFSASMALTIETMKLASDPSFTPNCNLNPILSCQQVMSTSQASVFGFANPLIGIALFAALTTVGLMVFAGAPLREWYARTLLAGSLFGLVFVHWLIVQSLYVIGSVCPYCAVVWVCTISIFVYMALYTVAEDPLGHKLKRNRLVAWLIKHPADITIGWVLLITIWVVYRFWYYFGSIAT